MPPAEGRGSGRGKPRKRKSRSIRDAAASAAGSASTTPAAAPETGARQPPRRVPPSPTPARPRGRRPERVRFEPSEETRPAFPDFESPANGWDPWGATSDTETGGRAPGSDHGRTLGDWFEAVIPPEAQVHFIRAGQEFAAGVQTTVDHHLGRGSGDKRARPGPSRIEIE